MLRKLLKYDLKWLNKVLIIYYIIFAFIAVVLKTVDMLPYSMIVSVTEKILVGFFVSAIFSTLITTIMRSWGLFYKSLYRDESYLVHTLPIERKTIFTSKVLASLISLMTSFIIIVLGSLFVILNTVTIEIISGHIDTLKLTFGPSMAYIMIIAVVLIVILELIFALFSGFFGIVLGHKSNKKRMVKSVIYGLISYMSMQIIMLVIIFVIGLFNPTIMDLFKETIPDNNAIYSLVFISFILYLLTDIIYFIASKKMFLKGIDVD